MIEEPYLWQQYLHALQPGVTTLFWVGLGLWLAYWVLEQAYATWLRVKAWLRRWFD